MKKIKILLLSLIIIILLVPMGVYAFTIGDYSMDIPYTWTREDGSFFSSDKSMGIKFRELVYNESNIYADFDSKQYINDVCLEAIKDIGDTTDYIVENYEGRASEISKNKYRCIEIDMELSYDSRPLFGRVYLIPTKKSGLSISVISLDENNYNTEEFNRMLDSFSIENYQAPIKDENQGFISWKFVIILFILFGLLIGYIEYSDRKEKIGRNKA